MSSNCKTQYLRKIEQAWKGLITCDLSFTAYRNLFTYPLALHLPCSLPTIEELTCWKLHKASWGSGLGIACLYTGTDSVRKMFSPHIERSIWCSGSLVPIAIAWQKLIYLRVVWSTPSSAIPMREFLFMTTFKKTAVLVGYRRLIRKHIIIIRNNKLVG